MNRVRENSNKKTNYEEIDSPRLGVGDLVCEKHHPDWMGVVLDVYAKNLGTENPVDVVVVEWVNNPNNTSHRNREEINSSYLILVERGKNV